ncbi:MAG: hypothetical protein IJT23_08005 [Clostridia bacterium]|nr:hypothetical protein [Clostridia bacterium]
MKEMYIDMMESVIGAYTDEHIKKYTQKVCENGLTEHGYPRLTANLGILIAHGRKTDMRNEFVKMMDICCDNIPTALKTHHGVGNDFSVKEIVFCLLELEDAGGFEKSMTDKWREKLALINPYTTYDEIADIPPKRIGNWAAFGAASEQLRKYAKIGDESEFIENQIKSQLLSFDENGMYRDPNEPVVYDMVTRLQLAVALYFGFDGESRRELEEVLMKSADITLYMQSVSGEIPFGGRSNQFLHNEAFFAALCEFYAVQLKKYGNTELAGQFKRAARIAYESISPWLGAEHIHHVKNFFDIDSLYGCERYAYFDKYMITTASWLYIAYIMADDTIPELPCPAQNGGYICETSKHFHKLFCNFGGYFVELDTDADTHYDSSGIGRIHRKGAPPAICLSVPFAENPNYSIDVKNPSMLSICSGIKCGKEYLYTYNKTTGYRITDKRATDEYLFIRMECILENGMIIHQECIISETGVEICAESQGELSILFPAFEFDGETHTVIDSTGNSTEVLYKGWKCHYFTDSHIKDTGQVYANRNGHYKCFAVYGKNRVSLKISIEKDMQ